MTGTGLIDAPILHSTLIRAAPERVYDALTRAEEMDRWFTSDAAIDARPGGSIRFRWKDWGPDRITGEDGGPVLEATRGERFVFQWREGPHPTTVEITFQPCPEGTIVRVRETEYPDTPQGRRELIECAAGWGEALTLLKFYVERGEVY